jgi:putative resolvase
MIECAARGYRIASTVKEIASGVNDARLKFLALLSNPAITTMVVEHKDRATRFRFRYLETLLGLAGRRIEVVNVAENDREDLLADLVSIVSSFAARLYGQRRAKRKTEAFVKQLKAEEDTERPSSAPLLFRRRGMRTLLRTADGKTWRVTCTRSSMPQQERESGT